MTFDILELKQELQRCLRLNCGCVFTAGFIVLLFYASLLISTGSIWAEALGNYTFYALVACISFQLVCVIRDRKTVAYPEAA
jgi:hypothetical protein